MRSACFAGALPLVSRLSLGLDFGFILLGSRLHWRFNFSLALLISSSFFFLQSLLDLLWCRSMGTSSNFRKVKYFLRSLGIHPYALAMWAGQHTTHLLLAAKVCRTMQPCSLLVHFFHIFGSNWCPTERLASVLAGTLGLTEKCGFFEAVCVYY